MYACQEDDSLAQCGYTSVSRTRIIHQFRGNKQGFTAGVAFRASIQEKVIDPSCGEPLPVKSAEPLAATSVKKCRATKPVDGCGPLLRVDDSLPGFTCIKGDPRVDAARHSSPYFRASTELHSVYSTIDSTVVELTPLVELILRLINLFHSQACSISRSFYLRTGFTRAFLLQIVLFAFCAIAAATPAYSTYHVGVPFGPDGKLLDTPEVARAKAAHLATQAYEAIRNTLGYGFVPAVYAPAVYAPAITYGAPIGADGRVVDTPEVAQAKAAHLAAHAQEAAKTGGLVPYGALAYATSPAFYAYSYAPLGPDGRVIDTPEVAQAKAAHLAAHAQAAARNAD
ncbi:PREDICTED: uncharacterized protein LOC105567418 [Vollenhovia emeryi]|uniref:uncharacterized protein LOC105567418 n=1 Tax=Vollenhovia emeryi TaxID=411798 RepID=UPI0005F41A6D|nr:PREDICTED: uncharacterized protein LOC105567418 [Vollenhovia emeryi]